MVSAKKASPLLRAWAERLAAQGVEIRTRWRWTGFQGDGFGFDTPTGPQILRPDVTVLALGGASWQRLGSDGAWVPWLKERGVAIAPWQPANMGFRVGWSPKMQPVFGHPVKGVALIVGPHRERGEFVISARGSRVAVYTVCTGIYETAAIWRWICCLICPRTIFPVALQG